MHLMTDNKYIDPFSAFVEKLQQQYEYLSEGGTSYRQRTAELALEVARKVRNVIPFHDNDDAGELVTHLFLDFNFHRREDVAKSPRVVENRLNLNATLSNEAKEHVKQKMSSEKKVRLDKVK